MKSPVVSGTFASSLVNCIRSCFAWVLGWEGYAKRKLGLGGNHEWAPGFTLFGEASVEAGLNNFASSYAVEGTLGIAVKFSGGSVRRLTNSNYPATLRQRDGVLITITSAYTINRTLFRQTMSRLFSIPR